MFKPSNPPFTKKLNQDMQFVFMFTWKVAKNPSIVAFSITILYPIVLQVERVISFFYYRRAGWNIVERKLAFPDEPLPDPAFLRKDFENCVLEVIMMNLNKLNL